MTYNFLPAFTTYGSDSCTNFDFKKQTKQQQRIRVEKKSFLFMVARC